MGRTNTDRVTTQQQSTRLYADKQLFARVHRVEKRRHYRQHLQLRVIQMRSDRYSKMACRCFPPYNIFEDCLTSVNCKDTLLDSTDGILSIKSMDVDLAPTPPRRVRNWNVALRGVHSEDDAGFRSLPFSRSPYLYRVDY